MPWASAALLLYFLLLGCCCCWPSSMACLEAEVDWRLRGRGRLGRLLGAALTLPGDPSSGVTSMTLLLLLLPLLPVKLLPVVLLPALVLAVVLELLPCAST